MGQQIFASVTVSASELRNNPCQYFKDSPVAVLSRSKTAGYMVSAELFEQMVKLLDNAYPQKPSQFRPSEGRLEAIAFESTQLLLSSDLKDLEEFSE